MLKFINSRPLLRASLTSMTVMSLGDMACQKIMQQQNQTSSLTPTAASKLKAPVVAQDPAIDFERTKRFALTGFFLHGPWFFTAFRWLDTLSLGTGLRGAFAKAMVGQVSIFPSYLVAFSAFMGTMEGRDLNGIVEKTKAFFLPTFIAGTAVWPAANVVNFLYVPSHMRVAYVNLVGLVWNAVMSYLNANAKKDESF